MCSDCNAARVTIGLWPYFDPKCIYCGARLIQRIGKVGNTDAEITQRRRAVLKDWTAFDHDEREIRELVARKVGERVVMAVEPATKGARA